MQKEKEKRNSKDLSLSQNFNTNILIRLALRAYFTVVTHANYIFVELTDNGVGGRANDSKPD